MLAVPNGDGEIKPNKFSRKSISGANPSSNKSSTPDGSARVPNGKKFYCVWLVAAWMGLEVQAGTLNLQTFYWIKRFV